MKNREGIKTWRDVIEFWFNPENRPFWFKKSEKFDEHIHREFYGVWKRGKEGLLSNWRETMDGRLAEIIVLDQFSRNLYRNDGRAFAQDGMALILAQEAVKQPDFSEMSEEKKNFAIMPFMHSESLEVHRSAEKLFEKEVGKETFKYELLHREILEKFGRYPHRNKILGRSSTPAELEFLKQPGSSF